MVCMCVKRDAKEAESRAGRGERCRPRIRLRGDSVWMAVVPHAAASMAPGGSREAPNRNALALRCHFHCAILAAPHLLAYRSATDEPPTRYPVILALALAACAAAQPTIPGLPAGFDRECSGLERVYPGGLRSPTPASSARLPPAPVLEGWLWVRDAINAALA